MAPIKSKLRGASPLIVAPAKGAHSRQMPGILVVSPGGKIRLGNFAAVSLLRPAFGDFSVTSDGDIPTAFHDLIGDVAARLRHQSTCSVVLPSCDVLVRACTMDGEDGQQLLLIVERGSRQDLVRSALASYPLTPRETEVATLVLRGYSNRRIADNLALAEYTVEDHLKRIFAKVGVRTRTSLASKILGVREEATG